MGRGEGHDVLDGVPETALWTLRNRAEGASGPDPLLDDPEALRLYDAFGGADGLARFGAPSQSHPLRAVAFDEAVRAFLERHPGRPVVALGEGLQTSYWRLGRPDVAWFSVDLPAMVAVQERLLSPEPRITRIAASALDRSWLERVPPGPAMVTAEGLFMYLPCEDVRALVADLAARFPGGRLVLDAIPRWFSALTVRGRVRLTPDYVAPPMPHSQTRAQGLRLADEIPGVASVREIDLPPGRGAWGSRALRTVSALPMVRDLRPSIVELTFAGGSEA